MEKNSQKKDKENKAENQEGKSREEIELERKKKQEEKKLAKEKRRLEQEEIKAKKQQEQKLQTEIRLKKQTEVYQSDAKLIRTTKNKPIFFDKNRKNKLITSALPYVNNVPHLGNIIGCVLSADVYARYSRLKGNNTIYICGTDEYGTATETRALKDGVTPKELCDKYYSLHKEIYEWFDIDFDYFGRTSTEVHTKITQEIFERLKQNDLVKKSKVEQYKCLNCKIFLADRYLTGTCHHPNCDNTDAGGDQCDKCGKLINVLELKNPSCNICGNKPELCQSVHYFLELPKIKDKLDPWLEKACLNWSKNSTSISKSFMHDGLKPRCITRDLKWGVQVPQEEDFKEKVFYVWFDAPIGYLSITANFLKGESTESNEWESWWKNPENVTLYQFMGKDNVAFHTIIFPCTLLGTGQNYSLVNHLSTTEYLTYMGDKFSKRKNQGVFGDQVKATNIPVECWRYYLLSIRPENGDTDFRWDQFAEKVNNELLANLGNLCNRVLQFNSSKFNKEVPVPETISLTQLDKDYICSLKELFNQYIDQLEKLKLREGLETFMKISNEGNVYFQKNEPWVSFKSDLARCKTVLFILFCSLRLLACLAEPYMPSFSAKLYEILNLEIGKDDEVLIDTLFSGNFEVLFLGLIKGQTKTRTPLPLFEESNFLNLVTNEKAKHFTELFCGKGN